VYDAAAIRRVLERARRLSQVEAVAARYLSVSGLSDGDPDDDKIPVHHVAGIPAGSLKPSQTTIKVWAVVSMAIGMLMRGRVGGDLGALISSDGHILDGHHRWASTILAGGPSAKVGGFVADIPGSALIRVLNIVTKGIYGRGQGNKGTGNLSEVNPTKVRDILNTYVVDGVPGEYAKSATSIRMALSDAFGSVAAGIDQMSANAGKVPKVTPEWAPDRTDMPIIEPDEAPQAAALLSQGKVNWQYPFHREANFSRVPSGSQQPDLRAALIALLR